MYSALSNVKGLTCGRVNLDSIINITTLHFHVFSFLQATSALDMENEAAMYSALSD